VRKYPETEEAEAARERVRVWRERKGLALEPTRAPVAAFVAPGICLEIAGIWGLNYASTNHSVCTSGLAVLADAHACSVANDIYYGSVVVMVLGGMLVLGGIIKAAIRR
jgi:hypothetical protein